MKNLLDVLITYQSWFLVAVGVILLSAAVLVSLYRSRSRRRYSHPHYEHEDEVDGPVAFRVEPGHAHEHRRSLQAMFSLLPISVLLVGVFGAPLTLLVGLWSKVFGSELISPTAALDPPALVKTAASNKKLLILIHGWNGDPLETWKAFPNLVTTDPTLAGFDIWPIAYPTFQVRRNLSIRQMSRWLNVQMDRDGYYEKYESIYIVSHSMGGLIARGMLLENRLSRDNKQYKSLIEIATPHQGADIGGLLSTIGVSKGFSDDLKPGSPMLGVLQDDWNSLRDRPKTYCLTSPQDSVVTQDSAIFQCDEFLRYPQWGHTDMVKPANLADERYRVPIARVKAIP